MNDIQKKAFELGLTGTIAELSQVAKLSVPSQDVFPMSIDTFDYAMDGGLREGELITISGISGQGKTSLTLNLAIRLSAISIPSLYFSYALLFGEHFDKLDD